MAKIRVLHQYYGCDTGCCGHIIEIDGKVKDFYFDHQEVSESVIDFIKRLITEQLGEEHVKDIDFENSEIIDC